MQKKTLFFVLVYFSSFAIYAHSYNFEIKYFGLNIHPVGDINAELMPIKLGNNGFLVPSFGVALSFEKYIWRNFLSLKFMEASYTDCALQAAGFIHFGFRITLLDKGRHQLNVGIGPTFIYRQSWYNLEGYDDSKNFYKGDDTHDKWQWRFIIYGGEFEYNYRLTDRVDFSWTMVPGIPILIANAFGLRIKF
jgi:hypothetical protein